MADFSYIAINKEGKQIKGNMQAQDANAVKSKLKLDGFIPVSIKAQSVLTKDIEIGASKSVKSRDLAIFCRQFTSIINAGVTVVEALRMLAEQTEKKTLKNALYRTRELVQQGETLAAAMSKSPNVFPEMLVNMVEAGEASGNLDVCVSRMGTQFEKSAKLKGNVKRAMMYPIAVLIVALVVLTVMSVYIIPKFTVMYEEFGSELPGLTLALVAISNFILTKWYILIIVIVALVAFFSWTTTTIKGKEIYGEIALKLPIFGKINLKSNSARFARTLSTLVASGMSITNALDITAKTIKNIHYKYALENARKEVEQGVPLSVPIRKAGVFPPLVHNMMAIGEETGNLEPMLDKIAEYYEEETEIATASLSELLQPLIIVVLGGLVGIMVVGMYLPMFEMYNGLGNL